MRPLLVYLTGQCLGAPLDTLDKPAAAVECIHSYSLIHDDLPAMDNADLRRGQPSCHKQFDEATAILAGDALLTLAFELLSRHPDAHSAIKMIQVLSHASGCSGLVGGQALDLLSENNLITLSQLETIHRLKTASLIHASVQLGALGAQCQNEIILNFLHQFGLHLGLAFQIKDDILDVEGQESVLGKKTGMDQKNSKSTYPSILGLHQAKIVLQKHYQIALSALNNLPQDTGQLKMLAAMMIE